MKIYKVASFVVIDFENGVDYISFSVFDFSALKNGTEYSFVNDQFQVNDYMDVTFIFDKNGNPYTEATLDYFIETIKVISDPSGDVFVPYTGAVSNVNLGEFGLSSNWLQIDTTPTTYIPAVGRIGWNDSDGTLEFKLKGDNVTLQIGQEQVSRVVNKTDPSIDLLESNYQVVKITGAQGNRLKVALAQANNDANSAETLGVVTETILKNQEGFITTSGIVRNINTTGSLQGETWADGDMIYLSGTVAGRITKVKPSAPIHTVIIGYVVRAHATQGQIYVKIDNGYELDELHNVKITATANKQSLFYNESTSIWENRLIEISDVTNLQTELDSKIDGSGSTNFIPKFSDSNTIENSLLYDNGSSVGIGTTTLESRFHVLNTNAPSFNAVTGYNAMKIVYDGGFNEDDFGAGITFFQKWFSGSSLKVATGGIFGVKTNGDGNFGGGLSFFYTPLGSSILTEAMRLTSAGYFGVGLLYPTTKFQVRDGNGNFYVGNSFAKVENSGGTTASLFLSDSTGSIALKNIGSDLLFFNSSTESMRLKSNGNVGIGTTNPSYLLQVNGRIQTFDLGVEGSLFDGINSSGTADQLLSSQGSYIAWKSIKTINGNSLIGSGDITISSSGLKGIHTIIPLTQNQVTNAAINGTGTTSVSYVANRVYAYPYIPNVSFTSSSFVINVGGAVAGSLCRIAIYSDLNSAPNSQLYVSTDIDCSTAGIKTISTTFNFVAGTTYWLVFHGNATVNSLSHIPIASLIPISSTSNGVVVSSYIKTSIYTNGTPNPFGTVTNANTAVPLIGITKSV